MSTTDTSTPDRLPNLVSGENVFAALLVAVAVYMFVTAYDFPSAARLFPQVASGLVIVAAALRVINYLLPYEFTRAKSILSGGETDTGEETTRETEDRTRMLVLGTLITGYILGGYLVGLFWVTPVFALAYLTYTRQKWWVTAIITAALTGIAYGFIVLMNIDIVTGAIYG